MRPKSIKLLDVKINNLDKDEVFSRLDSFLLRKKPALICTLNTEFIVNAQKDPDFKEILNKKSSLNLPDGFGILWASKFESIAKKKTGWIGKLSTIIIWLFTIILIPFRPRFFSYPIASRITGVDFVWDLARFSAAKKAKIFLLGGAETIAERTALQLQSTILDLKIAGINSSRSNNADEIISQINKSKSDILMVAFGSPKQELWLAENLNKTKCKIGIGVGGSFDMISGVKKRAPRWMQKSGLEWLFRLIHEPKRFSRQLALPKFMYLVLKDRISN